MCESSCSATGLFRILSGKWMLPVLFQLHTANRPIRFGELQRAVGEVTQAELTRTLRQFESLGLVQRTVYAEVPPRVEYACTDLGNSLKTPLGSLATWLKEHQQELQHQP